LLRGQGTYLSDEEINQLVDHCSTGEQNFVHELVNLKVKQEGDDEGEATPGTFKKRDDLYEAAVDLVVREGRGSSSLLQRALGIGYGRAARLIDFMAEDGIVGQYNGSQAREVAISIAEWEAMRDGSTSSEAATAPSPPRSNKIQPLSSLDESGPKLSHHLTSLADTVSAASATKSMPPTTRNTSSSGSAPAASPKLSVRRAAPPLEEEYEDGEEEYEDGDEEYEEELEDEDTDDTAEEFEKESEDGEEEYEDYEDV